MRYVVIMHDADEGQAFWDFHEADSEDEAVMRSANLRDYAVVVDVIPATELVKVARRARNWSKTKIDAAWEETIGYHTEVTADV